LFLSFLFYGVFFDQIKYLAFGNGNDGMSSNSFSTLKDISRFLKNKQYELFVNNIYLGSRSRIRDKSHVFLRLTLDKDNVFDIGRRENWSLKRGQQIKINQKISIEPQFVFQDKLHFSIELMSEQDIWNFSKTEVSLLRCRTSSQGLSLGSRSFECSVPGEAGPVISYGLVKKAAPFQDLNVNKLASY
jgi:hypothetical protein